MTVPAISHGKNLTRLVDPPPQTIALGLVFKRMPQSKVEPVAVARTSVMPSLQDTANFTELENLTRTSNMPANISFTNPHFRGTVIKPELTIASVSLGAAILLAVFVVAVVFWCRKRRSLSLLETLTNQEDVKEGVCNKGMNDRAPIPAPRTSLIAVNSLHIYQDMDSPHKNAVRADSVVPSALYIVPDVVSASGEGHYITPNRITSSGYTTPSMGKYYLEENVMGYEEYQPKETHQDEYVDMNCGNQKQLHQSDSIPLDQAPTPYEDIEDGNSRAAVPEFIKRSASVPPLNASDDSTNSVVQNESIIYHPSVGSASKSVESILHASPESIFLPEHDVVTLPLIAVGSQQASASPVSKSVESILHPSPESMFLREDNRPTTPLPVTAVGSQQASTDFLPQSIKSILPSSQQSKFVPEVEMLTLSESAFTEDDKALSVLPSRARPNMVETEPNTNLTDWEQSHRQFVDSTLSFHFPHLPSMFVPEEGSEDVGGMPL